MKLKRYAVRTGVDVISVSPLPAMAHYQFSTYELVLVSRVCRFAVTSLSRVCRLHREPVELGRRFLTPRIKRLPHDA